jgi:hypothetical protein
MLRLYNPQKGRVFTSRDIVFSESTKYFESIKIKSPTDRPLDLDCDPSWIIVQKWDLWE